MKIKTLVLLVLLLGLACLSYAQATGTWALTSNSSYAVTGSVTANNMVKGNGTGTASYDADGVHSNGWTSTSQANAASGNDYYQYTVTATAAITINAVSLYTMKSGGKGGTGAVYYSVNGGTETQIGSNITLSTTNTQTSITGLNIAVPNGQTFRVRFYAWSLSNSNRSVFNRGVTIVSTGTTLASTDPAVAAANVGKGTVKLPIYKFTLTPTSALNLTGLSFTSAGTYAAADLDNFKLWSYGSDTFASATQVGTTLTTGLGAGSHSFASFTQALTAGVTRYFWITADLDAAATLGNTLSVSALTTSDLTVSLGAKAGTAYAGGTQTIVYTSLATDYFRSNGNGNWGTPGTWQSSPDNTNWETATLAPSSTANTITILSGHTVTVAAGVSIDQTTVDAGGQVIVNSGTTLTIANGTGTDMTVNGTLRNNAGTITTTGTLAFGSGALYQSNFTTTVGLIPTATWNAASTCEVIGYTTFAGTQTGLGQTFGNFTWNCPAQTGTISAEEALDNIAGSFTIAATNTGQFRLGNATNTTTVGGNLIISGGTLDMSNGSTLTMNLAGNFTLSGGTLTETGRGAGAINFAGTTPQLITITGTPTISNVINFAVNSGATVEFASDSTVLSGSSGTFTANSGSTLIIKHADGIASSGATGCVQTTGTRTLSAAANYTYSGSTAQVTGTGRTGAANLVINNTAGVTLSAGVTITGTLTNNGRLNTLNYQLAGTVVNNGTIAAARTTIMSSGTLTNNTGSTIEYTTPLNIPASTGYYNLTLSASGTYNLTGNVTGISTLTLTTPTTYLQIGSYTVGYATLAGLGSILSPNVALASTDPAIIAANIGQSTTANPAYKFSLTPNYAMNFTGLSFTTSGSYVAADLVNFKLLTNTTDTISGATQVGTTLTTGLGAGSHSFAAFTQALTIDATRYFWITTDVAASATAANTLTVSALTTSDITTSTGSKSGTAYNGGTQTIVAVTTTLASANLAVSSGNFGVGTTANVFYAFNLTAVYPVNLTAVTIASTGTATDSDLNNMRLWTAATDSFASATQIGSTLTTGLGTGNHAFTGLTQALSAGATRYFWVSVEIDGAATVNRTITGSALTTSNFTVSLGSKTGTAYAGGTQTIIAVVTTLASANPAVSAANIGRGTLKNPIYRFTLNPTAGVNCTGLNFVANGTYLAADIDNFKLWTSLSDTLSTAVQVGTTLTTIAASGSQQTFASFTQALSAGVTRYFWITTDIDAAATAARTITVAALTTARVTVSLGSKTGTPSIGGTQTIAASTITLSSSNPAIEAGNVVQGTPKMPLYRFVLTRDAATATINLTGLTFSTSGTHDAADVSRFQLWYSTVDDLKTGAWVGGDITTGLGTGSHTFGTFTVPVPIVESTAHYFWITATVNATAVVGHTFTVAAVTTANITLSAGTKTGSTSAGSARTVSAPVTTISSVEPNVEAWPLAQSVQKRPLVRFRVTTDGLVNITGVSFTSGGDYSASDITKFQLWTGINDDLTGAGQIGGDITTSLGAGSHSFGSFSLSHSNEEPLYFWITTDAASAATVGKKINVNALTTSNFTVSVGSKAGSSSAGEDQTFCAPQPWLYAIGQPVGPLVGAGTGYQLRVTVHYGSGTDSGEHVYLNNRCRPDFADLRFYEGPTQLDYWIQSMTRYDKAIIWVEISGDMSINSIPFSIRFGNQSVTTTSNGSNTFLFFDDFNRTDNTFPKWAKHKTLDGSTIDIPVGKNYARLAGGIPTGTYGHSVLGSSPTYTGMTDASVEYGVRVGQDAISEVGVRGTFANPGTGYKGRIDGRVNYQGGSSILYPPYYSWTWLADAPELFDWPTPGAWYHCTLNAFGTTINLLKDDVLKRTSTLGTVAGPGEISLQNHYGPYSDYDWVAVRKYVGGLEPAHGAWIWAPTAYEASAVCHNGFTAHWEAVPGATGYQLDVLEDDGVTIVDGWNSVPVSLTVHRVEVVDIATANKYRIRALFNTDVSPNSNVISVSTTEVIDGVTASTTILGEPVRTFVPPVVEDPPFTNNDITIDPTIDTTWDYSLVVTWHPDGYDTKPNARLVATVNCSENSALSGTYNINHAGMGFTPAAAAYKWAGQWYDLSPTFGADSTIVVIPTLSKGASKGELIIVLDNGSGTLPVELTSFLATITAYNKVQIKWVTQSETNVSGYRIYRGISEYMDEATSLGAFIPATNTSHMQVYQYVDEELTDPGTYYYWLENLDLDGSSMLHGPVQVMFNSTGPEAPSIPVIPGVNNIYPNPFNPNTTIRFGILEKGEVQLVIYNLKGQIVRNLLKETKNQGTYDVLWNGKDNNGRSVSSGVYVVKMKVGRQTWNSKLVLSK